MKKRSSLIVTVSTLSDIDKIDKNTKYINLDITNPNYEIITYFVNNGYNYLYSDITNNVNGYNYVNYDEFVKAENLIEMIYAHTPSDLNEIELAKYLYVSLGRCLSSSINANKDKTEVYNLPLITNINNIWGSLACGITNNVSASKLYYYLCRRLDINCSIETEEDNISSIKLKINGQVLLTNLYKDIPYIWCKMQTRHFATYNDDIDIDKKIKYIKNKYNDCYIDKALKDIDYMEENCIWKVLSNTQKLLDIDHVNPAELSIIYTYIFEKYCPNYNIKINNLYLKSSYHKHFIMISYNNLHYSYNYKKKTFIKITEEDILNNLQIGKIGLYEKENIPNISNYLECIN